MYIIAFHHRNNKQIVPTKIQTISVCTHNKNASTPKILIYITHRRQRRRPSRISNIFKNIIAPKSQMLTHKHTHRESPASLISISIRGMCVRRHIARIPQSNILHTRNQTNANAYNKNRNIIKLQVSFEFFLNFYTYKYPIIIARIYAYQIKLLYNDLYACANFACVYKTNIKFQLH